MTQPVFIFSTPRSGSTLLQRVLLATQQCATLGEPSLLLRFLGDHRTVQRYASYRENNLSVSLHDMQKKWSGFDSCYQNGVRRMMLDIYSNLSEGKAFFIDKTPRYTLIAEEIHKVFPDAKFIVLWRHPLAIASSIHHTFYKEHWRFDDFIIDLTTGMDRLHQFEVQHEASICSLKYEDLVSTPEAVLDKLGDYLGLPELSAVGNQILPKDTGGNLGDPSGTHKYATISKDSRDKWMAHYSNWYRQSWAKTYFEHPRAKWLGELGYTLPENISGAGRFNNLIPGLKDLFYTMRKKRSHKKRIVRELTKHHIYPYTYKPKD
ncbi:hypothetical protein DDZ13_13690 [Coraliomargarita sinensis]|uniref:Sulfotransferase n=1 Tax=Coraliomargarita sinensis TaxID=2174842 RepID=A0A317ZD11_9BACT|nr:sulfotransferase [Coraliomargarita sinensis]PXA03115.1 hypothetical protein DDZ13_13690 [Coraliomargarita sinensis]